MENLIALCGHSDAGKTTTLLKVVKKILADCDDVRIAFDCGNKTLAIATFGDNEEEEKRNFAWFEKVCADICVCACRKKGSSVEPLEIFARKHKVEIERIEQKKADDDGDKNRENAKKAREIFDKIQNLCNQ